MIPAVSQHSHAAPTGGAGEFLRQVPDVVAAGLTLSVALWVGGDSLALSPFLAKALPVAFVLIAAILKLIDQPKFPSYSLPGVVFGAMWCAAFHMMPMFWVLFLTLRLEELSPALFLVMWLVLTLLLLPMRLVDWARLGARRD